MQNSGWLVDFSCCDIKKEFPKFKGQNANKPKLSIKYGCAASRSGRSQEHY